jgi:outer membrane biosynthesis protein TonB
MSEKKENNNRRRALISTLVVHGGLLILFLFVGLTYYDPKPEDGILINFGNSETGQGEVYEAPSSGAPQTQSSAPVENNQVLTQDVVDAPTIDQSNSAAQPRDEEPQPQETNDSPQETQNQEPSEPDPKPSETLQNLLNNTASSQSGGEGETQGSGDQGREDGDPNSNNYTGNGGGGNGDGNYLLGNRKALSKPRPNPCEASGRVVVKIYVDQNGKVVRAVAGEKVPGGAATTTTNSCLFDQARRAALATTWESDRDAPMQQSGYIIYNFTKN